MYYTVHLTDYPEYRYGYNTDSQRYEFNTMDTINEYQGKTEEGTWAHLQHEYPSLPRELFTVTHVYETRYIVVYRIPNTRYTSDTLYSTRYVLQSDSSLIHSAHSVDARKFRTKGEADNAARGYGILTDCYHVEAITDEF